MQQVITRQRQQIVIPNVDWREYARQLRFFADRPGYRLTYDRGTLEIMSPLLAHDNGAYLLGRFVDVLTEELNLPVKAGRSTTFRRRRRRQGIEPDNSYWIANELPMRGKRDVDLRIDPPPDLCIEIDVTNSSLDRMGIYAALGVPEVWRLETDRLQFNVLQANHQYALAANSLAFAHLTPADLLSFLTLRDQQDDTSVVRLFREWVRLHYLVRSGFTPPTTP